MSNPLIKESFTNEFGQVINPGDKVVFVAAGYSNCVKVQIGEYVGYRNGSYNTIKPTVIVRNAKRWGWVDTNGKKANWDNDRYKAGEIKQGTYIADRQTTLHRGRVFPTV